MVCLKVLRPTLNAAEMHRKWITQSFFISCLDSRKQPITSKEADKKHGAVNQH